MGEPKQLLRVRGKTLVRTAAEAAVGSGAKTVVVVTGASQHAVEQELRGLPVRLVHNPDYLDGMSTSLRTGLRALRPETDACIVMLADQPFLGPAVLDALIATYRASGRSIVQASYRGKPGNPVLWDRMFFNELGRQVGDQGGRSILRERADQVAYCEIPDPMANVDVDTPDAYADVLRLAGEAAQAPDPLAPRFCARCGGALESRQVDGKARPACRVCGQISWLDPKLAAAVVLPMGDRIVLGKRAIDPGKGLWSFPSGYVDRGEVVEDAACREVREELGVDVRLVGLVGVYSAHRRPVVLVVYAGEIVSGEPRACSEVTEVSTFLPGELPPMAFQFDDVIVRDWLKLRGSTGSL